MVNAFVLGKFAPSAEKSVIKNLKKIAQVKFAEGTFGQYDFIAHIEVKNEDELKSILVEKVRAVPGIISTTTLVTSRIS